MLVEAVRQAADKYAEGINLAQAVGAEVDPEAQLTNPLAVFIQEFCEAVGIGQASLLREAHLDGVKPDFDVRINNRQCGWIELKRPGHSLDGTRWRGREKQQWELLAELDALMVTDGFKARLYRFGAQVEEETHLPGNGADGWDSAPLESMLRLFASSTPSPIKRVSHLARRLAPLARMLRDHIASGLTPETPEPAVRNAKAMWAAHVHDRVTDEEFAGDLAQVIAYSLAIASMQIGVDANQDKHISLEEARNVLRARNGVLAAALGPTLEVPGLYEALSTKIGAIERLVSGVDQAAIADSTDPRGEPWLWFYEDFLSIYDPVARKRSGVYYTPTPVVHLQVRHIDHILREVFGRTLGFGDKNVITLDPATGSGTYPLAVLDQAAVVAEERRGPAGPRQVAGNLINNLLAFEILPGPYAVAHLRVGQRLATMEQSLTISKSPRVYLTDTLDDPDRAIPTLNVWGDPALLAAERRHAQQVKRDQPVTVILGNPPYNRGSQKSGGGWVLHNPDGRSLYDDVTDAAKQAGVIFSAMRSMYDDYLYFWRWSLWKAFEQKPDQPAILSFITSSSWLSGPAFLGLRKIARQHADEMWIVDLGGQGRGAVTDQNVFDIQTPVAIVTLYRKGKQKKQPATVYYRRVEGTAEQKLAALDGVSPPTGVTHTGWQVVETDTDSDRVIPDTGDDVWAAMPALSDLFPWQCPGVNRARSWPTEVSKSVLQERWRKLLESPVAEVRKERFVSPESGRNIFTRVAGRTPIAQLPAGSPCPEIRRYAYRSFDRQWLLYDPRLLALERPALWQSLSDHQLFLTSHINSRIGEGPALVGTIDVPDFHHFHGNSGGKDVIPLYRDAEGRQPNLTAGVLDALESRLGPVTPEDLAAYVYGVMAHPAYQERFEVPLQTPGPRVPMTADPDLFREAVDRGAELLWLHSWGQRYRGPNRGINVPILAGWSEPVSKIPTAAAEIVYDADKGEIHVGDGIVTGVTPAVWEFSVSGFPVLQRWLQARTARGIGRSSNPKLATPLDRIRPSAWEDDWNDELLELVSILILTVESYPAQAGLLDRIVAGPLIAADSLPTPSASERKVPKTVQ